MAEIGQAGDHCSACTACKRDPFACQRHSPGVVCAFLAFVRPSNLHSIADKMVVISSGVRLLIATAPTQCRRPLDPVILGHLFEPNRLLGFSREILLACLFAHSFVCVAINRNDTYYRQQTKRECIQHSHETIAAGDSYKSAATHFMDRVQ